MTNTLLNPKTLPSDLSTGVIDRFWVNVNKTNTCWLWTRTLSKYGYGVFSINRRNYMIHRVAYELVKGKIPKGLHIDHLCRVRHCVNPDHLEPVTLQENVMRGTGVTVVNKYKTSCNHGHAYTPENTYLEKKGRQCKECRKAADKKYKAKRRELQDD